MDVDVVLIGGGVASARCARTLRRNGFAGSILLVGDEPMPPYNRPPLSKELMRGEAPEELLLAEPPRWYERHGVELRTGVAAVELHADRQVVILDDGSEVRFSHCLLATGATARPLSVPGGDGVLLLRSVADARRIREAATSAAAGASVLVVGGGLIGVELAGSLATLGLRPTVVEMSSSLWAGALGSLLARWAVDRLREAGVTVRTGGRVDAVTGSGGVVSGAHLPAAFVVAGIGARARDELAVAAGLAAGGGGVEVDDQQRTTAADVWAAGDVARPSGRPVEHWHAARESGERAALSMLGLPVPPPPAAWTFTEVAGIPVDAFGEAPADADEAWLVGGRAITRSVDGRVRQLLLVGGRVPDDARALVQQNATDVAARRAARTWST